VHLLPPLFSPPANEDRYPPRRSGNGSRAVVTFFEAKLHPVVQLVIERSAGPVVLVPATRGSKGLAEITRLRLVDVVTEVQRPAGVSSFRVGVEESAERDAKVGK